MEPQQPLVCPSHITQYIGVLIIGIIAGAGASFVYFKQAPQTSSADNTYQAGFDAAKKRIEGSAIGGMLHTPDVVLSVSGTVTAVNGNRVTIRTQPMNPFEDPSLDDRTVVIATDTKITKLSQKDPKVMQAEMDAFMKKMQPGKTLPQQVPPPEPFTRTTATVADIAVGDTLNVTALENIKSAKEFSASEIQIQQKPITN